MGHMLEEDMLIQRVVLDRTAKLSSDHSSRLIILIEHVDGTDYTVSIADKKETPEHLTTLLAYVGHGVNMMIRALDILRTMGYVDVRPVALLGREIVFGLNRVTLELEIIENRIGGMDCGISVASVDPEKAEEIGGVLEGNNINVI